ncbi:MAG TPA: FxSxx-COOH system tetratricopeptide repeat protein [Pseudonocardiaceae bacterium]|nr:FxSxx-COOH system tetratricopeptide repeat protein [Pseudonocardiaceae bacterium]
MAGTADPPSPDPVHRTGSELLGSTDLTWSEVADAVWLTSVTEHAWRRYAPPLVDAPDLPPTDPPPTVDVAADRPRHDSVPDEQPADGPPERMPRPRAEDDEDSPGLVGFVGRPTDREPGANGVPGYVAGTRSTAGPTMPGALGIARSLRPLKRRVPSRNPDEVRIDEDATAEQAAQDGLWWPVTTPQTTPWLDLTVVVDSGPSMALWQPVVSAFMSLLEQLGAFRSIRRRLLDAAGEPRLLGGTPGTPTRDPRELMTSSGRRIMLLLTDGVGAGWKRGLVSPMLARWGTAMPVAVVHLLPQRLWRAGGLPLQRGRLTVPRPLAPNRRWGLALPDAWLEPDPTPPDGVVPVPVVELGERWLGWLARLVTGTADGPATGMVLLADDRQAADPATDDGPATGAPPRGDGTPSADDQVRNFLSIASPQAFRLATLLAAVPVSLPVAQLVQSRLVPESGPAHLAEVLGSGLLRPPQDDDAWDATYEYPEAVREVLLSGARRSETAHVVRMVTGHFGDRVGLRHLRDALDAPDSTPDHIGREDVRDVMIERIVLRALSGPYLSRASRLSQPAAPALSVEVASSDSVSKMSNTVERTGSTDESTRSIRPPTSIPETSAVNVVSTTQPHSGDVVALPQLGSIGFRERLAEDAPPVWGNVPPRNPNFTGRSGPLDQLSERLAAGGTTAVLPAALHGMGGIGKTQMAVEYIYRHLTDYDIVWWVQAAHPAQIRAGLTELAQHLGLPGSAEANTAVPAVREALRLGQPYRRWLLVFDAAESPEMVRPFFPANGPGEILITSRNPDWAGIARPLEIAVFQRSESIDLLRLRGPEIDDREAELLADKLGDLPLAIEQAAAWRAETGMPVSEYVRLFDEKVEEILDTSAPVGYELSVAAAWNVSFDELRNSSPAAHQLLQVCAFFAPEPITRSLFSGVRGVSVSPELDAALRDPMRLSRAIRDINRYGLAKIDHRSDTLLLHRLVQMVLRNRMTPQHRAEMRHGAHLLLANLDPNDPSSSKVWPRYQDVLSHVHASEAVECDDSWVRQLVINVMRFLYQWGDHQEAARLAKQAYDNWAQRLGETDSQTLEAAEWYGYYSFMLGRYAEAEELNRHTLELRRQVSGVDSEETLSVQTNVVLDLRAKGEFNAARELTEDSYQKAKALYGPDDPATLSAAHNHAVSLRFTGDYRQARDLDEDTYLRRVEVIGYDNAATFSTFNALILDRRESGEYRWAHVEMEKLAERAITLFGEHGAATLRRQSYLAVTRRKDGDHPGALALSGRTLERFRVRYGNDQPNVLNCAIGHSIDLRHSGDLLGARELGEQTFDRFRDNFGELHPHTLAAAVDIAVTLRLSGDAAAARQLDERSLDGLRERLGADHPFTIVAAINVASDLSALGELERAVELDREALERSQRFLGTDHPTTLAVTANLALDLRTLGHTQEAETKYAEILTKYRQVLGDAHPATIAAGGGVRADCDIDLLPF